MKTTLSPLIQLDDIHLAFQLEGQRHLLRVLDGINLDVYERQFLTILGPSGCGKSTLLRVMAGLLEPDQGNVKWEGELVKDPETRMSMNFPSRMSMNFQKPVLLPWLSVRENALLPLGLTNKPNGRAFGSKHEQRLKKLLDITGLENFVDAFPYELSVGMQMRVALVRALITSPDLIFMDEPFAAIDELTRQNLGQEYRSIAQDADAATVFVTHSIHEAAFLSDRIIILSPRPARILKDIDVAYSNERTDDLRRSTEYLDLCDLLRKVMVDEQIRAKK